METNQSKIGEENKNSRAATILFTLLGRWHSFSLDDIIQYYPTNINWVQTLSQGLKNHQNNTGHFPLELHSSGEIGDPELTKYKRQFHIVVTLTRKKTKNPYKTKTLWLRGLRGPTAWKYFSSSHQGALAEETAFEQWPEMRRSQVWEPENY